MDAFQTTYLLLHLIDWGQTLDIADRPDQYRELNPILGSHPTRGEVNRYMAASAVSVLYLDEYVFKKNKIFRNVVMTIVGTVVVRNTTIGLRVNF